MCQIKTYSELIQIPDFYDRFRYLKLNNKVGIETFGFDRYLNQVFYKSPEWIAARRDVIVRDHGLDMGTDNYPINGKIYVHHMNPLTEKDLLDRSDFLLNPEYLISVSFYTHNAIHFGDESLLPSELVIRTPNDTIPWRT